MHCQPTLENDCNQLLQNQGTPGSDGWPEDAVRGRIGGKETK